MLNDRKHHKTDDYRLFAKSAEYAKLKIKVHHAKQAQQKKHPKNSSSFVERKIAHWHETCRGARSLGGRGI